ncbi:MAG: hypothetical protein KGM17_16000 [Sphingomonadales bacterium]|nr:hypothetical protein [Sphingomonadales bacterium]
MVAAALACIGAAPAAAPAAAQAPGLAMLDRLESGRWELREHGQSSRAPETLCISSGRRLIQLRHQAVTCESYVVDDGPLDVTVQYTCRGRGYGRTHIRRESSRLVQVESQGIADGFPFDFAAEGRRVGDCTSTP